MLKTEPERLVVIQTRGGGKRLESTQIQRAGFDLWGLRGAGNLRTLKGARAGAEVRQDA